MSCRLFIIIVAALCSLHASAGFPAEAGIAEQRTATAFEISKARAKALGYLCFSYSVDNGRFPESFHDLRSPIDYYPLYEKTFNVKIADLMHDPLAGPEESWSSRFFIKPLVSEEYRNMSIQSGRGGSFSGGVLLSPAKDGSDFLYYDWLYEPVLKEGSAYKDIKADFFYIDYQAALDYNDNDMTKIIAIAELEPESYIKMSRYESIEIANFLGSNVSVLLKEEPFKSWPVERSVEGEEAQQERYYLFHDNGVELICDSDGIINTIFLRAGYSFTHVDPRVNVLFMLTRTNIREEFGEPGKSGEKSSGSILDESGPWDQFRLSEFSLHFQYQLNADKAEMITLMRHDVVP